MSSRRTLKAASAIREVISMAILTDIRDPRVTDVTVTSVEVSGDMRQCKVHVSIMGDEKKQELCLHGLKRSAGYLQSRIKDRIDTRFIPKVEFELDQGVKQSLEINRILQEVLPKNEVAAQEDFSTGQKKETDLQEFPDSDSPGSPQQS